MKDNDSLLIVHVVRQFFPAIGGMENFVEQLALQQLAAGHRVRVVTLDRVFDDKAGAKLKSQEQYRGIEIRRVPFTGSRRYPLARGVLKQIRPADLLHVHGVDFFVDFLAATVWLHRKPMVLTTHGGFFHTSFARRLKSIYFQTVTRASLSQFGAVIACSEEDARRFGRIAGARLTLIPNPVDIDKFKGLANLDSSTLIYFGRLAPNKGLEQLIAWFSGLVEHQPHYRLIIAGKPMGTSIADLTAKAAALNISSHVEIHDTPSDAGLKELIARSAAYCCASTYEGFGLAAIEGASAGLLPLLSDIPPFRDNIDRLGFGMVVDFNDPASWSGTYRKLDTAVADFRRDFDLERIGRAVEPFAWSGAGAAFDDVYRRALGQDSRRIGPVKVSVHDQQAAMKLVTEGIKSRQTMMVAFCNAHTANLATKDPALRTALERALVLNDGVGVDIAGRWLFGSPFPANLNGTDFVPNLIRCARPPLRIFLLGGEPGAAEGAAREIVTLNPDAEIAGTMHGYFDDEQSEEVVDRIRRSGANLVLVAMGQPRQEVWTARHFQQLPGPALCVGALFDFLAGRVPRAPALVRRFRLEWTFRLAHEPRRLWRRYLVGNASFLFRVLWQRIAGPRI